MESNASTSRYILTALCIILVITAFVLVGLNALNLESRLGIKILPGASSSQLKDQYRQGYLAAREKYSNICPMVGRTGNTLSGVVETVSGNSLTVRQNSFDTDATIDGVSDVRTVSVTGATTIEILTHKSSDILSKELAAFKPDPKAPSNPPSPFVTSTAKISAIKVGDNVTITSDKELRTATSFTAQTIRISR